MLQNLTMRYSRFLNSDVDLDGLGIAVGAGLAR
jgi:hypothetical protein